MDAVVFLLLFRLIIVTTCQTAQTTWQSFPENFRTSERAPRNKQQEASATQKGRAEKDTTDKAALSNRNQRGDLHADKREEKLGTVKKLVWSSQQRKVTMRLLSAAGGLASTNRLIHLVPVTSHVPRVVVLEGRPSISSRLKSDNRLFSKMKDVSASTCH